jgi:hypothetical protein
LQFANQQLQLEIELAEIEKNANQLVIKQFEERLRLLGEEVALRQEIETAQANIANAQLGLNKEILKSAQLDNELAISDLELKKAQTESDEERLAIERQIIAIKRGSELQALDFARQELDTKIALFDIESRTLQLVREEAILQAELALMKARNANASSEELALLERSLAVQKELANAEQQQRQIERDTLEQQRTNNEKQRELAERNFEVEDAREGREFIEPAEQKPLPPAPSTTEITNNINVSAPDPFETAAELTRELSNEENYQ